MVNVAHDNYATADHAVRGILDLTRTHLSVQHSEPPERPPRVGFFGRPQGGPDVQ